MKSLHDNSPEFLIIHHSWSPDNQRVNDWDAIRKYHMSYRYKNAIISPDEAKKLMGAGIKGVEAPWLDIGYHFGFEYTNGQVTLRIGRDEATHGAHCNEQRMNYRSLGICVVGCFDEAPPHPDIMKYLAELCADKCRKYNLTPEKIQPHRKYNREKTCPGTAFPMDELQDTVRRLLA